jgi:two-component system response regulator HydG
LSNKSHILIVDDEQRMAKTLADICELKGHMPQIAHSGHDALKMLAETSFDCVLTDVKMAKMDGVELFRAMKAIYPDLPVVLMTAYSLRELLATALDEGVTAVVSKPVNIDHLLGFFAVLDEEPAIVIVDDDPDFCRSLGHLLRLKNFTVSEIADPASVSEQLAMDNNHVVLLDMSLKHIKGLDVLKELKEKDPHVQVILVTAFRQEQNEDISTALKLGAQTCLYKPFEFEELLQTLKNVQKKKLARILGQPARRTA